METGSDRVLPKHTSKDVAIANLGYVEGRMNGTITSLRTKFPRFNENTMDGIERNTIVTISAPSGGGKSTLAKELINSVHEMNPLIAMNIYNFNFEMTNDQAASREIVTKADISLKKLYSVGNDKLQKEEFERLKKNYYAEMAKRDNYFYIEVPADPSVILNSMWNYYYNECKPYGKMIVTCLDHTLLIKNKQSQSDRQKIDELMNMLIEFKKTVKEDGGSSMTLVLSQMNRDIYSKERILNPTMHRPKTSDLFGASSIEFASDLILFAHAPGKLNLTSYTENNYPTWFDWNGRQFFMIYFELVKNRSGEAPITIPMLNMLHRFRMEEMDLTKFKEMCAEFKDSGACSYREDLFGNDLIKTIHGTNS